MLTIQISRPIKTYRYLFFLAFSSLILRIAQPIFHEFLHDHELKKICNEAGKHMHEKEELCFWADATFTTGTWEIVTTESSTRLFSNLLLQSYFKKTCQRINNHDFCRGPPNAV